ncbi:MAG: PQQ-binding-like beta-propeller repeat protein [bacterium]|nr:PQQ-binding-like beta-propeller repeat protein [bacterium]
MTRKLLFSILAISASLATLPAAAADWSQWRGPERDAKSPETGLLQEWPEGGPPLAWKTNGLGSGYSSLTVTGGRIYTMGDLGDGQYMMALAEDGGKLIWKTRVGDGHEDGRGGSRSTPTPDGERVYAITTGGDLVCLGTAKGEERWRRSLPEDFGGYLMKAMGSYEWRFSESPLVDGQHVVVTPGHIEALMVALNKETGEEIWRTQGRRLGPVGADGAGYSSAVISEAAGTRQYVQLVGRGLIGVEAESGKLLWNYNRVASDIANIATPVVHGDYVLGSAGYGTGSALVKIRKDDEAFHADEVYFLEADVMQNHHGGLILHEGTVYTGTGHNKGFPLAVDFMKGEVVWGPERTEGADSAAIVYADDRLYFRYRDGRMILIEATTDAYHEHGTFMIPDVEKQSWTLPVIAGGKLLLREQDNLFAYDIRAR